MILVTGAGGKTGKAVLKALVARGAAVRAFARSAAHHAALNAIGVHDVEVGEMDDPRAWSRAIRGTSAVYHICPNVSPHELPFAKGLIAAAATHGIRRFVYHSVLHPQIEAMPHHWAKLRVEELLFSSGLDVTILQPTAYMQNSLAEWDRMVGDGVYRTPYPVEAWTQRARSTAMDDYQLETLAKMFEAYARDGLKGNPNVLVWLIKRPPTSLATFAARMAAAQA